MELKAASEKETAAKQARGSNMRIYNATPTI